MRDNDIDDVLGRAAGAAPNVDPALLDRISKSIGSSLCPVRPLPPSWILVSVLIGICALVAVVGAVTLGLHGIHKMNMAESGMIFPILAVFIWLAATTYAEAMVPGSRYRMGPWSLTAAGCAVLVATFALLFRDYRTEYFVRQGVSCLTAGLLHAVPTGIAGWLLLRRGFAVDAVAAGVAQGLFAGLAGVSMLELHCPNFEAPHVMLWHTAVLPLSGALGALIVWAVQSLSGRRRIR